MFERACDLGRINIFGSRARGDYQKFSDIDILIEASHDLGREISQVAEVLENSNWP